MEESPEQRLDKEGHIEHGLYSAQQRTRRHEPRAHPPRRRALMRQRQQVGREDVQAAGEQRKRRA